MGAELIQINCRGCSGSAKNTQRRRSWIEQRQQNLAEENRFVSRGMPYE
jgi:hypothetical protein